MREFEGQIPQGNNSQETTEEIILNPSEDELADALMRVCFYESGPPCLLAHPQILPGEERVSEPGEAFLRTQDLYEGWSKNKRPY